MLFSLLLLITIYYHVRTTEKKQEHNIVMLACYKTEFTHICLKVLNYNRKIAKA